MEKFSIAGLTVEMNAKGNMLYPRSRQYLCDADKKADITIDLDDDFFKAKQKAYSHLSLDECRYIWTGESFYLKLLNFNGFMLHSSCIAYKGNAYLFSARSGTGKSTHTHLWFQEFDGVEMINDDKPALRIEDDGKFYAYGTPFSGKNDESKNKRAPIRAIVFIERATENSIAPISSQEAITLMLSQVIRPKTPKYMCMHLDLMDKLLKTVPVFKLKCNMDPEAAHVSYAGIEAFYKNQASK